jgi:hypothetical protein
MGLELLEKYDELMYGPDDRAGTFKHQFNQTMELERLQAAAELNKTKGNHGFSALHIAREGRQVSISRVPQTVPANCWINEDLSL